MEIHRLKPMKEGYDKALFEKLYQETELLRRKLTYTIDEKRFGYSKDIIYSWFSDKFIFIFNKYYGEMDNNLLKAHIIKGLGFYRNRILKFSYSLKNSVNLNSIPLENLFDIKQKESNEVDDRYIRKAMDYLKHNLSEDAFKILTLEINPPLYILQNLPPSFDINKHKIPSRLISEYMGLGLSYVNELRRECKQFFIQLEKRPKPIIEI